MVNEINKIIRNTLATGGEGVFLPGIGSLTVESRPAVRTSRKTLEPPRKTVVFHDAETGFSIIDELVRLGVGREEAHEIYNEWRVQSYSDGNVRIEGAGVLRNETFTADKEFLALLNPHATAPARIKPKPDKFLYIFAVLCCLFALCVAGYIWNQTRNTVPDNSNRIAGNQTAKTEPAGTPVQEDIEIAAADLPAESEPEVQPAEKEEKPAESDKHTVLRTVSGHSYLVLGIFSTEENAFRAVANAELAYPHADYRVYRYADKFLVSLFEAATSRECIEYKRTVDGFFPDTWVYTKK